HQKLEEIDLIQHFISSSCRGQTWWLSIKSKLPQEKLSLYSPSVRALGLWFCLIEMDNVKYPLIFSNKVNGSFLLNSMTGKSTEFVESLFETKRMLIWENKLPAIKATRIKTCNMLNVGQCHNHLCPCCEKQKKPLSGTKIR
ncbi:UNVERIFIED_CONTAM: hypothetical protein Sindi_0496200, partial [Sesamum indicum]